MLERGATYTAVNDILAPRIVVDVDCDAAKSGDFGGELFEAGVVLPNAGNLSVSGQAGEDFCGDE